MINTRLKIMNSKVDSQSCSFNNSRTLPLGMVSLAEQYVVCNHCFGLGCMNVPLNTDSMCMKSVSWQSWTLCGLP